MQHSISLDVLTNRDSTLEERARHVNIIVSSDPRQFSIPTNIKDILRSFLQTPPPKEQYFGACMLTLFAATYKRDTALDPLLKRIFLAYIDSLSDKVSGAPIPEGLWLALAKALLVNDFPQGIDGLLAGALRHASKSTQAKIFVQIIQYLDENPYWLSFVQAQPSIFIKHVAKDAPLHELIQTYTLDPMRLVTNLLSAIKYTLVSLLKGEPRTDSVLAIKNVVVAVSMGLQMDGLDWGKLCDEILTIVVLASRVEETHNSVKLISLRALWQVALTRNGSHIMNLCQQRKLPSDLSPNSQIAQLVGDPMRHVGLQLVALLGPPTPLSPPVCALEMIFTTLPNMYSSVLPTYYSAVVGPVMQWLVHCIKKRPTDILAIEPVIFAYTFHEINIRRRFALDLLYGLLRASDDELKQRYINAVVDLLRNVHPTLAIGKPTIQKERTRFYLCELVDCIWRGLGSQHQELLFEKLLNGSTTFEWKTFIVDILPNPSDSTVPPPQLTQEFAISIVKQIVIHLLRNSEPHEKLPLLRALSKLSTFHKSAVHPYAAKLMAWLWTTINGGLFSTRDYLVAEECVALISLHIDLITQQQADEFITQFLRSNDAVKSFFSVGVIAAKTIASFATLASTNMDLARKCVTCFDKILGQCQEWLALAQVLQCWRQFYSQCKLVQSEFADANEATSQVAPNPNNAYQYHERIVLEDLQKSSETTDTTTIQTLEESLNNTGYTIEQILPSISKEDNTLYTALISALQQIRQVKNQLQIRQAGN